MANWVAPVHASVNYGYGVENSRYASGHHTGIDYGVPSGTGVHAAGKGVVVGSGWNDSYGWYIKIRHPNGYYTLYAHLKRRGVSVGEHVNKGQQIALSGGSGLNSTADHLHFEVRKTTDYGSDVDPMNFIGPGGYNQGAGGGRNMVNKSGNDRKPSNDLYGFNEDFLKHHPVIANIIEKAQKHRWSDEKFQQALKETDWWRDLTNAQQQWQILKTEKPGEAKDRVQKRKADLMALASNMGIDIDNERAKKIAERAEATNMTDQQILSLLAERFDITGKDADKGPQVGQAGSTLADLRAMAYQYGVPSTNKRLENQVQRVLAGKMTVDGLRDYYVEQAKALYPTIEKQLDNGRTVDDMMTAYASLAQQELGLTEDQIKITQPKWTKALTGGAKGMMTTDEWLETIRTDKKYGWDDTDNARSQASKLAEALKQKLGNAA